MRDSNDVQVPLTAVALVGGPLEIRGAVHLQHTSEGVLPRRMGRRSWSQLPDDFMPLAVASSTGVRLAFSSSSSIVELDVRVTKVVNGQTGAVAEGVFDLVADGILVGRSSSVAGNRVVVSADRVPVRTPGPSETIRFENLGIHPKSIELWLPYTEEVELIAMRADGAVSAPAGPRGLRWVHHGSSISHGSVAVSAVGTWPAIAARLSGADLTNLSISGNAMLDQLTARTIKDTEADVISLKIGINLVNADAMRLRAFRTAVHGFLDTIRDGHPSTPILMVSPLFCGPVEHVAGPTVVDPQRDHPWFVAGGTERDVLEGKLCLSVIRRELATIVRSRQEEDPALFYLDGLSLYGPGDEASAPMPDNLHPGAEAHRLIGERFAAIAFGPDGVFSRAQARAMA